MSGIYAKDFEALEEAIGVLKVPVDLFDTGTFNRVPLQEQRDKRGRRRFRWLDGQG